MTWLIDPNVLVDTHHFIGIADFLLRLLHHSTGGGVGCAVLGAVLPFRAASWPPLLLSHRCHGAHGWGHGWLWVAQLCRPAGMYLMPRHRLWYKWKSCDAGVSREANPKLQLWFWSCSLGWAEEGKEWFPYHALPCSTLNTAACVALEEVEDRVK